MKSPRVTVPVSHKSPSGARSARTTRLDLPDGIERICAAHPAVMLAAAVYSAISAIVESARLTRKRRFRSKIGRGAI